MATQSFNEETEQACRCAVEQAAIDIPSTHVGEIRPYQYPSQSGRWYVEVDLHHPDPNQGTATALYRVRERPDGSLTATKVDLRETEEIPSMATAESEENP